MKKAKETNYYNYSLEERLLKNSKILNEKHQKIENKIFKNTEPTPFKGAKSKKNSLRSQLSMV